MIAQITWSVPPSRLFGMRVREVQLPVKQMSCLKEKVVEGMARANLLDHPQEAESLSQCHTHMETEQAAS